MAKLYPVRKRWGKVFKPHLEEVAPIVQASVELVRPDFKVGYHIPREAGWTIDVPWPRTRTCAAAYQMFGYCHHVAAYMLPLARLGLPSRRWVILNAEAHSVVYSPGTQEVLDLNSENDPTYADQHIFSQRFHVYADPNDFLDHLREQDWRSGYPIHRVGS